MSSAEVGKMDDVTRLLSEARAVGWSIEQANGQVKVRWTRPGLPDEAARRAAGALKTASEAVKRALFGGAREGESAGSTAQLHTLSAADNIMSGGCATATAHPLHTLTTNGTPLGRIEPKRIEVDRGRLQELLDQGVAKEDALEAAQVSQAFMPPQCRGCDVADCPDREHIAADLAGVGPGNGP